jgi:hypothetical protein
MRRDGRRSLGRFAFAAVCAAACLTSGGCTLQELVRFTDDATGDHLARSERIENDRTTCPRASFWEASRMR